MASAQQSALPIVLTTLSGAACTVVGGGRVAGRKVAALGEAGARRIRVVAPRLTPELERLHRERALEWTPRRYQPGDLADSFLAIAATDDIKVNRAVAAEAGRRGILINVVDAPELGNFIMPASLRRGDLLLGVSTAGTSPTLAMSIRDELGRRYGPEFGRLLAVLESLRPAVAARLPLLERRRCFWRSLTSERMLAAVRDGHLERVEDRAGKLLAELADHQIGRVEESDATAASGTAA
jgi:precorrin-2 dehydrogenase/sirohydrochlorin ferrochelatase